MSTSASSDLPRHDSGVSVSSWVRGILSVLCAAAAVVLAGSSIVLGWFNAHVQNEDAFVATATSFSSDQRFQQELADAATQDVMNSSEVKQYLGSSSDSDDGLFGSLRHWARGEAENLIKDAAGKAVASDDFRTVWENTARATHRENTNADAPKVLTVDAGPIYDEVNQKIQEAVHLDLGLNQGSHTVAVEQTESGKDHGKVAGWLAVGRDWGQRIPMLVVLAAVFALAACLLSPRRWALVGALVSAGTGIATWAVMTLESQALRSDASGASGVAGIVQRYLVDAIAGTVSPWATTSVVVGLAAAVLLIIIHVALAGLRRVETRRI